MIMTYLQSLFSHDLLIELSETKITIQRFRSGHRLEYSPWLALEMENDKPTIKAIGDEAKRLSGPTIRRVNPFSHPRSFVGNFQLAEKLLQHGIREFHPSRLLRPAPRVVIHQLEKAEGGLTDIEIRVLRELALGGGAREVIVHTGKRIHPQLERFEDLKSRTPSH